MASTQQEDAIIGKLLKIWPQRLRPDVQMLINQFDWLVMEKGVLYMKVWDPHQRPFCQSVLLAALKPEMAELHDAMGDRD